MSDTALDISCDSTDTIYDINGDISTTATTCGSNDDASEDTGRTISEISSATTAATSAMTGAATSDTDTFSTLSVEALEDELSSLAARLAASTCRFLLAVAEYDRRRAYESWECHDMAAWLSWKCGISPVTAREQVRVARCLETLHVVRARFSTGTLSYSQVRAITRVATPETEAALVDLATISTAAQLESLTRAYRRTREAAKETESRRYRRRYLQMHYDDEGFLVGSFRLPPETGSVLYEAVRQLVDHERLEALCASEVDQDIDPYAAGCADALLELVTAGAAQGAELDAESDDRRYLVTVLVDADTLSDHAGAGEPGAGGHGAGPGAGQGADGQGGADPARSVSAGAGHELPATESEPLREPGVCQIVGGPGLWSETARRVACDAAVITVTEDRSGGLLDLGRRTRRPSRALRRALRLRDGHCQFSGCTRRRTEAHHIVHWVDGGATALDNLLSLCSFHHHRLHEGGYRVVRERTGEICFVDRDGRVLPEIATLGPDDDRPEPEVEAYHCDWDGSRMPYGDVIEGLLQVEGLLQGQWLLQGKGSLEPEGPVHDQWSLDGQGSLYGEGPVHDQWSLDGQGSLYGEGPVHDQWSLDGQGSLYGDEGALDSAESQVTALGFQLRSRFD